MSIPEAISDPNRSSMAADKSNHSGNGISGRMRTEIRRLVILCIIVFIVVVGLDLGDWLDIALHLQAFRVDDIITGFIAVSFVLVIFLFRSWREVQFAASQRAVSNQLSLMTSLLHSCFALEEASTVISHFARFLFPKHAGALYVFRSSRNLLELATTWGAGEENETMFRPEQCWGLRQGQMYTALDLQRSIRCGHVNHDKPYTCLPLMAHGEVLALLHVFPNPGTVVETEHDETNYDLLRVFIEPIALALSNLKLRDTLRQQSIRDPLTGLFNRRYLEEALAIEIQRAKRNDAPFCVIMLDLDHFKLFNDTHGHEAGDAVLQVFSSFLQRHVRGGDIACRFGGEEFTLILPATSLEVGQQRAEQLCSELRTLNIEFKKQMLGPLTVSVGIASFPNHGESGEMILQAADRALYQAKGEGRDRVVAATIN